MSRVAREPLSNDNLLVSSGYPRRSGERAIVVKAAFFGIALISGIAVAVGQYSFSLIPILLVLLVFVTAIFGRSDERSTWLFYAAGLLYIISTFMWPRYVALYLPGLPLINPQRMANIAALMALVVALLWSDTVKRDLALSIRNFKVFWVAIAGFAIWRVISVSTSSQVAFSIYQLINELFVHVFFILFGVVFGADERMRRVLPRVFATLIILLGCIAVWEFLIKKSPFAEFADPSSDFVKWALRNKGRDGVYRAQGTFAHPLMLSEFSAICIAFCWMLVFGAKRTISVRLFGVIGVCAGMAALLLSGSRSGYGAALVVVLILLLLPYAFRAAASKLKLGEAATLSFFSIAVGVIASWAAIVVAEHAFGGQAAASSNAARVEMYNLTLRAISESPVLGFGVGMAPQVIGVTAYPGGQPSVDSFFLTLIAESGLIGLGFFCLMIVAGMSSALGGARLDSGRSFFAISIFAALVAMTIFKSILSLQDNNFALYFLLGLSVAVLRVGADKPPVGN